MHSSDVILLIVAHHTLRLDRLTAVLGGKGESMAVHLLV
jgi:hypothetical protein